MTEVVLVRAAGGQPTKLVALEAAHGLVYAANPDSLTRIGTGESWPVGFPEEDVFVFDDQAFAELCSQWEQAGRLERHEWRRFRLKRYQPLN